MFLLFLQLFSDGAKFQLMIICYKVERTGNHALGCRRAFSSDLHVSQGIVGLMKQSDFIVIHQLILVWMVMAACKVHSKHQVLFWIIVSFPEGWNFFFFGTNFVQHGQKRYQPQFLARDEYWNLLLED